MYIYICIYIYVCVCVCVHLCMCICVYVLVLFPWRALANTVPQVQMCHFCRELPWHPMFPPRRLSQCLVYFLCGPEHSLK